jgi:sulfur carrier protein ThiS
MVKLILRDKEYEVKPGMTLLSSLEKCGILSESVIATRDGELILDDEILQNGDVIKLVAVISGGSISGFHEEHEDHREEILVLRLSRRPRPGCPSWRQNCEM